METVNHTARLSARTFSETTRAAILPGRIHCPGECVVPPTGTLIVAAIVTLVAGAVQGTIGFGSAVLAVPILTMVDPALTPIPQILLSLPLTITVLARERTRIDLRGTGWVLLGRLPGAIIGVAL
ncbi:MAG: sulfite exporter TauE/SafE family protein, partial [Acidimicrobiia bacterium]|nr:sulfite exporter TauE/SafE family protein [Acidimicrobiia bacterium]